MAPCLVLIVGYWFPLFVRMYIRYGVAVRSINTPYVSWLMRRLARRSPSPCIFRGKHHRFEEQKGDYINKLNDSLVAQLSGHTRNYQQRLMLKVVASTPSRRHGPFCRSVCMRKKCKITAGSSNTKITAGSSNTKITTVTTRYWRNELDGYEKVTGVNKAEFFARQIGQQLSIPYLHVDSTEGNEKVHKTMFESDKNIAYPIFTIDEQTAHDILMNKFGWKDEGSDIIVFVHGFNTSIEGAKTAARQIRKSMDLTNNGRSVHVIAYDWASTYGSGFLDYITNLFNRTLMAKVIPSIAKNYAQDSEAAQTSVRPLVWLLYVLLAAKSTRRIHIIGHSMGTRIVSAAIKSIVNDYDMLEGIGYENVENHKNMITKVKLLIFKQADMDIANMAETLATIERVRDLIHQKEVCMPIIFAHTKDQPLNASKEIHAGLDRVGLFDADKVRDIMEAADTEGKSDMKEVGEYLLGTVTNWENWEKWRDELQKNAGTNVREEQLFDALKYIGTTSKWQIWLGKLVGSDEWKKWTEELTPKEAGEWKEWLANVKNNARQGRSNPGHHIGILKDARVFLGKDNEDKSGHSYFDNDSFQTVISEFVRCYTTYVVNNEYPKPENLFEVLRSLICIYQQYIQPQTRPQPQTLQARKKDPVSQVKDIVATKIEELDGALNVPPTPAEFQELGSSKSASKGVVSRAEVYAILNASL